VPVIVAVLGAVAAFDMTIVVPVAEAIVVPVGMLLPVMTWPTTTELRLDTEVIAVLPDVRIPVTVAELGAVAAFDSTMVEPLDEATVVPDAIPVPLIVCPLTTPARLDTPVTFALPEVTKPVTVMVLLAVAALDIVIVLEVNDETVVLAAMPVPVMACPATSPAVLNTPEIVLLPVVTKPVMELLVVLAMVLPAGMPVPVMGCPTIIPVMLLTFVMFWLPEVTLPVAAVARLDAVAAALMVMEPEATAVMVVPVGMPAPEMGCPTTAALVDTVFSTLLPETVTAVAVVDALPLFDIVSEVTPTLVMTVFDGMPVPVTG